MATMDLVRRAGDNVNLVVFENIQPIVWITTIPFFVICLTSCVIRLYTRAFIQKPFGTDDWLMLIGSVSSAPVLVAKRPTADSNTDPMDWSTVYCLDVDCSRRRAVSKTLFLINSVSNYFEDTLPIPASKLKTSRKSTLYVATVASAMPIHTDHRDSTSLWKNSTTSFYNSLSKCPSSSSTVARSRRPGRSESRCSQPWSWYAYRRAAHGSSMACNAYPYKPISTQNSTQTRYAFLLIFPTTSPPSP